MLNSDMPLRNERSSPAPIRPSSCAKPVQPRLASKLTQYVSRTSSSLAPARFPNSVASTVERTALPCGKSLEMSKASDKRPRSSASLVSAMTRECTSANLPRCGGAPEGERVEKYANWRIARPPTRIGASRAYPGTRFLVPPRGGNRSHDEPSTFVLGRPVSGVRDRGARVHSLRPDGTDGKRHRLRRFGRFLFRSSRRRWFRRPGIRR